MLASASPRIVRTQPTTRGRGKAMLFQTPPLTPHFNVGLRDRCSTTCPCTRRPTNIEEGGAGGLRRARDGDADDGGDDDDDGNDDDDGDGGCDDDGDDAGDNGDADGEDGCGVDGLYDRAEY